MVISTASRSFPNLFTILPLGVVSKNDIGLFMTPVRTSLWNVRADLIRVSTGVIPDLEGNMGRTFLNICMT